jgi:hypothetical protein
MLTQVDFCVVVAGPGQAKAATAEVNFGLLGLALELGLAVGQLGRERCALMHPLGAELPPTLAALRLASFTYGGHEGPGGLITATEPPSREMGDLMRGLGRKPV